MPPPDEQGAAATQLRSGKAEKIRQFLSNQPICFGSQRRMPSDFADECIILMQVFKNNTSKCNSRAGSLASRLPARRAYWSVRLNSDPPGSRLLVFRTQPFEGISQHYRTGVLQSASSSRRPRQSLFSVLRASSRSEDWRLFKSPRRVLANTVPSAAFQAI